RWLFAEYRHYLYCCPRQQGCNGARVRRTRPARANEGVPTMQREPVLELLRSVNELVRLRKELASMAAGHESFAERALLAMLERNGEARVSQIACLMHVDISVTSRQLA